jgi:hypothetical protein
MYAEKVVFRLPTFPFLHQLSHRTDSLLDGHIGIHAMLIVQINRVNAQTFKGGMACLFDVFGSSTDALELTVGTTDDTKLFLFSI